MATLTAHGIASIFWLAALFFAAVAFPAWRLIRSGDEQKKRRELKGGLIFLILLALFCLYALSTRGY